MQLNECPLIDADTIHQRIGEMARQIDQVYAGRHPVLLVTLSGAFLFAADLVRQLRTPVQIEFVRAQSYRGTQSATPLQLTGLNTETVVNRHVIVVEDIVDTGRTAHALTEQLQAHNPASIRLCALLDKPARREVSVTADYVGFAIEDHFVVGYGLDYDGLYRQLPAIHVIEA